MTTPEEFARKIANYQTSEEVEKRRGDPTEGTEGLLDEIIVEARKALDAGPCAMCGTYRPVTELDDAMTCIGGCRETAPPTVHWKAMVSLEDVAGFAADLLGDDNSENTEYERALIELLCDVTGITSDHREWMTKHLRSLR